MKKILFSLVLSVLCFNLSAQTLLYNEDAVSPGSKAEMPEVPYQDIYTLLSTIPGVSVDGHEVSIRGSEPEFGEQPLVLFDGVETDLDSINVYDVASVDVLKGPEALIYGERGMYGVISIRSKTEKIMKENESQGNKGKVTVTYSTTTR